MLFPKIFLRLALFCYLHFPAWLSSVLKVKAISAKHGLGILPTAFLTRCLPPTRRQDTRVCNLVHWTVSGMLSSMHPSMHAYMHASLSPLLSHSLNRNHFYCSLEPSPHSSSWKPASILTHLPVLVFLRHGREDKRLVCPGSPCHRKVMNAVYGRPPSTEKDLFPRQAQNTTPEESQSIPLPAFREAVEGGR